MKKDEVKSDARRAGSIATNRKAYHQYIILDRFEAGIALLGTEVKAIRDGQVDLSAGFARIENDQATLYDVHIKPYEYGHQFNHEPRRPRRLLLHRREIRKLFGKVTLKGRTLVPLALYFNRRGKIKLELGLCQGKHMADRRETLKRKTADRETARAMAAHRGK
ncbi:MAG: SsrA-binding protein SmpB [Verrucomicrobia bacterium]|nr:SsrA-binding protein SmpB [Verrucomicrobiota bacterium]MCG2679973.1 SsrA-binding protein SmpB [Kiritimatiellia bacterium]MBU4247084.1 SsrA-binding protein SmpB [Verrucomicrobiota bacterium]MBU4290256.1 SsrA-binding protein SmpB [Verrucomicrobiota bacterium]MBU4429534.1 SsrA-binding protein SmpB [Verrucomicrobiota bacterium]